MYTHQRSLLALLLTVAWGAGACSSDAPVDDADSESDEDDDEQGTRRSDAGARDSGRRDSGTSRDATPEDESGAPGSGDGEPTACDASAAPTIPALALEPVVTGLEIVVYAAQPPDASDWYLVQQGGLIRVYSDGELLGEPFLDLSEEAAIPSDPSTSEFDDERGLLGLAFAPDYATSRKFYVMLTPTSGAGANRDTVREYQRSADDPFVADPASMKTLVQLAASEQNHNGGNLVFGPDGMLYVGTGDGGGNCNSSKPGGPQNPSALFGKILRIDPTARSNDAEVVHHGLRNPFRFGFDRATGDLYIGDVGQNAYEEVDFAPAGATGLNFGWPAYEGAHESAGSGILLPGTDGTCAASELNAGDDHTPPIVDLDRRRSATGPFRDYISVVGGRVYRGGALPALQGVYLFGDYEGDRLGALVQCGAETSEVTAILKNRDPNTPNTPSFARAGGAPAFNFLTAIVEDNEGELYVVANFDSLLKVVPGQ